MSCRDTRLRHSASPAPRLPRCYAEIVHGLLILAQKPRRDPRRRQRALVGVAEPPVASAREGAVGGVAEGAGNDAREGGHGRVGKAQVAHEAQHGGRGRVDAGLIDEDDRVGECVNFEAGIGARHRAAGGGGAEGRETKPGEWVAPGGPADGAVAEIAMAVEEDDGAGVRRGGPGVGDRVAIVHCARGSGCEIVRRRFSR